LIALSDHRRLQYLSLGAGMACLIARALFFYPDTISSLRQKERAENSLRRAEALSLIARYQTHFSAFADYSPPRLYQCPELTDFQAVIKGNTAHWELHGNCRAGSAVSLVLPVSQCIAVNVSFEDEMARRRLGDPRLSVDLQEWPLVAARDQGKGTLTFTYCRPETSTGDPKRWGEVVTLGLVPPPLVDNHLAAPGLKLRRVEAIADGRSAE
jgi:hypothetical protein